MFWNLPSKSTAATLKLIIIQNRVPARSFLTLNPVVRKKSF